MSDFLISVLATMDPHELQAIHFYTLHAGISDAAKELARLRAENQRLREENEFLKSRYQLTSPKMNSEHTWIAKNHWPRLIGPCIDLAVSRAVEQWRDACDIERYCGEVSDEHKRV